MGEQDGRGLRPDPGHAGDVVDRVAGEAQEVGHLVGVHAVARLDLVVAPARPAGVVPLHVARSQQLAEILVGRQDQAGPLRPSQPVQGAADQVVGLVARVHQHRQAERAAQRLAVPELAVQLLGRGLAVGLVGRVEVVAEARLQRLVEGHHQVRGPLALEQLEHEAGEAVHRVHRPAVGVLELVGHRVPGPEHVQAGVHEVQRAGHAQAPVQSVSSARGSGRARSGAASAGVPRWTKPATSSSGPRPSVARMAGS